MAQVLVVYPSGPSFDMDYYLKTHMPLVASKWGPLVSQELQDPELPGGCSLPSSGHSRVGERRGLRQGCRKRGGQGDLWGHQELLQRRANASQGPSCCSRKRFVLSRKTLRLVW
ncbi:hypothetical protein NXS19_006248 [Fusarium pseudograminearum]|nr:hypothetical protein NXS19_006248 [Fusarium pseudograminearum]